MFSSRSVRPLSPVTCTGFFFVLGLTLLWSYATERLLTHASPLYEGTTGAAVRGFFLQTRTALLALAVHLDGWQGREHRPGSTTPCEPRSVPERLHKCRTSWVVSGSARVNLASSEHWQSSKSDPAGGVVGHTTLDILLSLISLEREHGL